jgi:hypothetical protein
MQCAYKLSVATLLLMLGASCHHAGIADSSQISSDALTSMSWLKNEVDTLSLAPATFHAPRDRWSEAFANVHASEKPEDLLLLGAHFFDSRLTVEVGAFDTGEGPVESTSNIGDLVYAVFLAKFYEPGRYEDTSFAPYFQSREATLRWARSCDYDLRKMREIFEKDRAAAGKGVKRR